MARKTGLRKTWGRLVVFAALGCRFPLAAHEPNTRAEWKSKYERPATIPFPPGQPYTEAKEELGRTLFFDPRISGSGSISCASCHNPGFSWTDGLPKAIGAGMKQLPRRTPTILNLAWSELLFWDGRAETLEAQALGPVTARGEMNRDLDSLVAWLASIDGYRTLFARAYPEAAGKDRISAKTITGAIATFERTVHSGVAPFDRWIAGDEAAIPEQAKSGFDLFNGKAGCVQCHAGWNFTDGSFHDIGLMSEDPGRGRILKFDAMQHAFKTPTLRNVDQRAPYMHDGSEGSLPRVIEFYDRGGDVARAGLASEIRPLHLAPEEKQALAAFLATLTSRDANAIFPRLPR